MKEKTITVRLSLKSINLVRMEVAKRKNKGEKTSIKQFIDEMLLKELK